MTAAKKASEAAPAVVSVTVTEQGAKHWQHKGKAVEKGAKLDVREPQAEKLRAAGYAE